MIYQDNDPASRLAARLSVWCKKNKAFLICQSCENLSIQLGKVYEREGIKGIPAALVKNFFSYWSKKYCSHVFVISNDGERVFKELGYKSVSKTPLGFDENIFYPDKKGREAIRAEKKLSGTVFSYFGRIVPEKGIHILLAALAQIKDLDWQLLMDDFEVYKSPYISEIKKQIDDLGLHDRVVYFHASHIEIARYMNAADVVVLASVSTPKWIEQYGRVVPEAMACGKLVVIARSGALPELAGDAGIIFEEKNVTQLTGILRDIIIHPDSYTAYFEMAYQRAYSQLSVTRQTAIMDNKFRELIRQTNNLPAGQQANNS
jgi:glycosyltransferase involved in cell wall biosynthesis